MNYINSFYVNGESYYFNGICYSSSNNTVYTITDSMLSTLTTNSVYSSDNVFLGGIHTLDGVPEFVSEGHGVISDNIFIGPTIQYGNGLSTNPIIEHHNNIVVGGVGTIGSTYDNRPNAASIYDNIIIGNGVVCNGASDNVILGGGFANGCGGRVFIGGTYESEYTSEAQTFLIGKHNFVYSKTITLPSSAADSKGYLHRIGESVTFIPGDRPTCFYIEAVKGSSYGYMWLNYMVNKITSTRISNGVSSTFTTTFTRNSYGYSSTGTFYCPYNGSHYGTSAWGRTDGNLGFYATIKDFNKAPSSSAVRNDVAGLYMFAPSSTESVPDVTVIVHQLVLDN